MKNYPNNFIQSLGIAAIIILGLLVFSPVCLMLYGVFGKEVSELIYYLLAVGGSFIVISLIKRKRTGKSSFYCSIENKRIIPVIMVMTMLLYFGLVNPISSWIQFILEGKASALNTGNQYGVIKIIRLLTITPILEECIFSGILLDGLLKKYSPVKAILITSLLFGLVHLSPTQFVSGFIMGVFTGWIYYKTKSLAYAVIIHVATNLTSLLMSHFGIYQAVNHYFLLENAGSMLMVLAIVFGSGLLVMLGLYFLKKEFDKKETADQLSIP